MRTKILKRVNNHIQIVENRKGYFSVQAREYLGLFKGMGEWRELNMFSTFRKAVERKNMHIVLVILRELGYRNEFVKRRTDRNRKAGLI